MSEQTYTISLTKEQVQLVLDCLYCADEQFSTSEQNQCAEIAASITQQTGIPLKQEEGER